MKRLTILLAAAGLALAACDREPAGNYPDDAQTVENDADSPVCVNHNDPALPCQ